MSYPSCQKRSPEQWHELVEAQAASGQSQAALCAAHGLSKSSFGLWKRRVRASSSTGGAPLPVAPLFTPLSGAANATQAAADWDVELDLGDGVCLRVRRGGS